MSLSKLFDTLVLQAFILTCFDDMTRRMNSRQKKDDLNKKTLNIVRLGKGEAIAKVDYVLRSQPPPPPHKLLRHFQARYEAGFRYAA